MAQQTPQSLLSLPRDMVTPEAYRVLGLKPFESDRAKIKAAAEAAVTRLSDLKASADPTAWTTALKWTREAYVILSDASKKAAYDRKLTLEQSAKMPAVDPLAGVLPGAPTPAFAAGRVAQPPVPNTPPASPVASPPSPPQPSTPPPLSAAPALDVAPQSTAEVAVPRLRNSTPIRRRRGLPWMPILMTTFCIFAMAGLGGVVYMLQNGSPIVIYASGGAVPGSPADPDGDGRAVVTPTDPGPREKTPYDPVMGSLAGEMPPPPPVQVVDEWDQPIADPTSPANTDAGMPRPDGPMSDMPMADMPVSDMPMTEPVPATSPPPPSPTTSAPTPEQVQAGDAAIAAAKASVVQHQWSKMKELAEKAETAAVTPEQKELAQSLFQLVDLATYYRGAIEQGIGTLQAGNDFDLQPELKVVIVEVGTDKLIIRFNGKNKEYTFDTMPLLLAHKMARFALTGESPTVQAAMNAYQAIAPISTPQYREMAINAIEQISDEIEGGEPAKLVAAIRFVNQP